MGPWHHKALGRFATGRFLTRRLCSAPFSWLFLTAPGRSGVRWQELDGVWPLQPRSAGFQLCKHRRNGRYWEVSQWPAEALSTDPHFPGTDTHIPWGPRRGTGTSLGHTDWGDTGVTCNPEQNYHHFKIWFGHAGSSIWGLGPPQKGRNQICVTHPSTLDAETASQGSGKLWHTGPVPMSPSFPPCASKEPQQGTKVVAKGLFIADRRK